MGRFWPNARFPLFIGLLIFWLTGFLYVLIRDLGAGSEADRAVFARPEDWDPKELPQEFRFITHDSALSDVIERLGPCTRSARNDTLRYDLPSGGAVLIFPESPDANDSKIRGIQFYRTGDAAPPF